MKPFVLFVLLLPVLPAAAVDSAALKSACAAKLERLAERMLPRKELNEVLGFFGPVSKKYLPVFEEFNTAYFASSNKLAVIRRYLPKADAAVAEAKAMKLPAKYEAKRAAYVQKAEAFLSLVRLSARFGE